MNSETGSERELLDAHLDHNRAEVRRKVTGLTWELATTRLGSTPTSAAGIVKHLIESEKWWFRHNFLGEAEVPFAWLGQPKDFEFELTAEDSLESLLDGYDVACSDSRAAVAGFELSDRCARIRPDGTLPSLRWVYLHMINEVARHNGHLDIYRELLDGTTDRS